MSKPVNLQRVRAALARIETTLARRPELAGRAADYFNSKLEGIPMAKTIQVQIRLEPGDIKRADALLEALEQDAEFRAIAGNGLSRSAALRLAIVHGLSFLEERYGLEAGSNQL